LTEQLSREQRTDAQGNVLQASSYDYDSALRRQGQTTGTGTGAYRSYALYANGSVEGLESSTGALATADTYVYDPYGALEGQALSPEAATGPFRFQGFYSDSALSGSPAPGLALRAASNGAGLGLGVLFDVVTGREAGDVALRAVGSAFATGLGIGAGAVCEVFTAPTTVGASTPLCVGTGVGVAAGLNAALRLTVLK